MEWLGDIPEVWGMSRLRYITQCLDGKRIPLNSVERSERSGDVPYWGANSIMDYVDSALFDEELILLGEDGAPFFDPYRPVAFFSSGPVWPNNHIHVLRPRHKTFSRYITYCLNAAKYIYYVDGSTRDKLTQSGMNSIPLPWPPEREAIAIADFLDHETARIDTLIAKKTRFIELLKEKRQAVITQAVTKGLDDTVPMKDSEVKWLGMVPAHWSTGRLSDYCLSISTGPFGTALKSDDYVEGCVPVINPSHIDNGVCVPDSAVTVSDETSQRLSFWRLNCGDVITARRGELGRAAVITTREAGWLCGTGSLRLRPSRKIKARFFQQVLQSSYARAWLEIESVGSTMPNLSEGLIGRLPIAAPSSIDEQDDLLEKLDVVTGRLDLLREKTQRSIDLLKEHRAALITAAVTGKIDVREAA